MSVKLNIPQNTQTYTKKMPRSMRAAASYINLQESEGNLAKLRLGQEMLTNWLPKAVFARGLVDFTEKTFLECTENVIVYILPVAIGTLASKLFTNKFFTKSLSETMKKGVTTTAEELLKQKNPNNKALMPIKAAIATATLAIPLAEYSLSYVKNLFTLKLFKQADFNNIANLNKNKKEDVEKQKQVKESAKKHIKIATGIYAGCLALAALLATKGKNSKALQSIGEVILTPGSKFFKNPETAAKINKYFGLDFANRNGKLAMSNGQITACVVVGGFGYFGAAKDRGKQDFKEVLYRFPLVGFYAITGSELFEKAFRSRLKKSEKCKEFFEVEKENGGKLKLAQLGDIAEKMAAKKGTSAEAEFKTLLKQKSKLVMTPFLFSLGFMGFFVAGVSRYFTQYRYNKEMQEKKLQAKQ